MVCEVCILSPFSNVKTKTQGGTGFPVMAQLVSQQGQPEIITCALSLKKNLCTSFGIMSKRYIHALIPKSSERRSDLSEILQLEIDKSWTRILICYSPNHCSTVPKPGCSWGCEGREWKWSNRKSWRRRIPIFGITWSYELTTESGSPSAFWPHSTPHSLTQRSFSVSQLSLSAEMTPDIASAEVVAQKLEREVNFLYWNSE